MKIAVPVSAALKLQLHYSFVVFSPCKFGYAVLENILLSSSMYFLWSCVSFTLFNLIHFSKLPVDQVICHCC